MPKGDLYTYKGKQYRMIDIRKKLGVPESTFYARLKKGMTVAEAIEAPSFKNNDFHKYKCKPETGLPEDWLSLPLEVIRERALKKLER